MEPVTPHYKYLVILRQLTRVLFVIQRLKELGVAFQAAVMTLDLCAVMAEEDILKSFMEPVGAAAGHASMMHQVVSTASQKTAFLDLSKIYAWRSECHEVVSLIE